MVVSSHEVNCCKITGRLTIHSYWLGEPTHLTFSPVEMPFSYFKIGISKASSVPWGQKTATSPIQSVTLQAFFIVIWKWWPEG